MIKAVVFDVDGVLIDSFEANLKFFQTFFSQEGYPPPDRGEYKKLFHRNLYDVIKIRTKLTDKDKINELWERGKSGKIPFNDDLLKLTQNAEETLKKLSRHYPLGIVTSRVRESFYGCLPLQKIKKYFQTVVTYQDTQKHKPDPQPLLLACQKLGVDPKDSVYIGDAETDIVAAGRAGMKSMLYDLTNHHFNDLPDLIDSL